MDGVYKFLFDPGVAGTIFSIAEDGTGYRVPHRFRNPMVEGGYPEAGLAVGSDGRLLKRPQPEEWAGPVTIFRLNQDGSDFQSLSTNSAETGWRGSAQCGFALIELPVVIAIIATSRAVLPVLSKAKGKAQSTTPTCRARAVTLRIPGWLATARSSSGPGPTPPAEPLEKTKLTQIIDPGPSDSFVFIDENEQRISAGY